jgi:hypothetical protein
MQARNDTKSTQMKGNESEESEESEKRRLNMYRATRPHRRVSSFRLVEQAGRRAGSESNDTPKRDVNASRCMEYGAGRLVSECGRVVERQKEKRSTAYRSFTCNMQYAALRCATLS